jgi:hypothetical protein
VIAHEVDDVARAQGLDAFIHGGVVARDVSEAGDPFDAHAIDLGKHRRQRREVPVDVRNDRDHT